MSNSDEVNAIIREIKALTGRMACVTTISGEVRVDGKDLVFGEIADPTGEHWFEMSRGEDALEVAREMLEAVR